MAVSATSKSKPELQVVTEEVSFIEIHLPSVDPGFKNIKPYYQPLKDRFIQDPDTSIDIEDTEDLKRGKIKFLETLTEWNVKSRSIDGKDSGVYLKNEEKHSWEDVINTLESALTRYQTLESKGFRGKLRHYLRKCRDLKGPVESWIRLLPTESWQGSLLCGGLKVVVGVAAQLDDVREEINDMVEQVPIAIQTALHLKMVYATKQLDKYSGRLVLATMECMQQALEYFMQHPAKKFIRAAFKGKDYGKYLSESVKDFQTLWATMDRIAMNELHASFKAKSDRDDTETKTQGAEVMNSMKSLLRDATKRHRQDRRLKAEREKRRVKNEATRRMNEQVTDMWKDMLSLAIEWDAELAITDLAQCLRIGRSMSSDVESRTAFILSSAEVTKWIEDDTDQRLVVNAREGRADVTNSTVSFFSSLLLSSLNERATGVSLYWFCGQHHREDPKTMVVDLLGQLLHQGLKHVVATKLPNLCQVLDSNNIADSFDTVTALFFGCLAMQLQETAVYCILDSLSLYEDRRRVDDLVHFVTDFCQVTGRHPLKLLATSPVQCTYLTASSDLPPFSMLWVPKAIPRNRITS
ncbi:uncharacterized protein MYCFIDRAFT_213832 [Pseudocercospora fijiensis CIRAD86]|uniref:Nephrocystin 3-like N-terminal domain-containing protein n=1 Tax=Pseudocercospora fijiensis (strain CIRAD86) TaxID=383855 RepID=M3B7S9_PSEFD|nr:uncharacterized protein MYCFIDRAFT_213832 [Pseudocercospora fijiensis CIRAD86]EME85372.1 hypothetical protein MYCFIDRAFT_213832 [Pseudocercospora fijiensis CIRAD86]